MNKRALLAALLAVGLAAGAAFTLHEPPAPANAIDRAASYQDPVLLARAWSLPVAHAYGPAGYQFQTNPSFCGPTSVADVLHSEGVPADPQSLLNGTGIREIFGFLPMGLTLDQEAQLLATRLHAKITTLRGLTLAEFRAEMAKANNQAYRLVINFTRAPLFGHGHGHFSPILGYLPDQDLVFVGDVNAHYHPWLVPTPRLYAAQNTIDSATNAKRGLLEIPVTRHR
jgi:hypothetical protein